MNVICLRRLKGWFCPQRSLLLRAELPEIDTGRHLDRNSCWG